MSVAFTSKESYIQHVSSGNKLRQRKIIIDTVKQRVLSCDYKNQGGLTRRQLSTATGFELGATAGRVNKLVADGLLVDKGAAKCSTTGRMVGLVGLPEKQGQLI
jgi:hypothetical protein